MGYRSDVLLCLSREATEKLRRLCETASEDETDLVLHPESGGLQQEQGTQPPSDADGESFFEWREVKWYDQDTDFADVWFVMQFVRSLPPEQYKFWRQGEEVKDFEELGTYAPASCSFFRDADDDFASIGLDVPGVDFNWD